MRNGFRSEREGGGGTHLFAVLGEKHSGEAGVERVCVDPAAYPIATVALGAELLADRVAIIQSVEESRDTSQQTFSRNPPISCSSGTHRLGNEVEKIPTHKTHKDIE